MLCIIVLYVSASRAVFNVFCTIFCKVSVLRTVLNMLCLVFFFTLRSWTLFCMCSDCMSRHSLAHCFVCVLYYSLVR